jgi:hypothetical protein
MSYYVFIISERKNEESENPVTQTPIMRGVIKPLHI